MLQNRRSFIRQAVTGAIWIAAGNTARAVGRSFELPPAKAVHVRVAILSDGHFGQPETPFAATHSEMVGWVNGEKSRRGLDFAFINGDLFHNDPAFLPEVKKVWDGLSVPYYVSHGNHDMISEASWAQTWKSDWNYGFEKKGISFVVLNTADDKGTYTSPDVETTRTLLQKYNRNPLFIFMHITPVKWTENGIDCTQVVALFNKQENLKAIFNGHDHDQDNVKENKGLHYFFDSHVGGSWGTSYRGYRILEIMKDGSILTYQQNPLVDKRVNDFSSRSA